MQSGRTLLPLELAHFIDNLWAMVSRQKRCIGPQTATALSLNPFNCPTQLWFDVRSKMNGGKTKEQRVGWTKS